MGVIFFIDEKASHINKYIFDLVVVVRGR